MATERRSALFLSPEAPFPLTGGGALRSASLLTYLSRRYDVEVILFREPGAPDPRIALPPGLVRDARVIDLITHSRGTAARVWRNTLRLVRGAPPLNDRFGQYREHLMRLLAGRRYSIGVVEHFWCASYAEILRQHCDRLVLDLHNVESVLYERNGESTRGPERVAMMRFAGCLQSLERRLLPAFDRLLVTSGDDAKFIAAFVPPGSMSVYPNALPYTERPVCVREPALVFSGNMEYYPNRAAVQWFHGRIWPIIRSRHPGVEWRLVGKNPHAVRLMLAGDRSVRVVGAVKDAVAEIASTQIAVAPLRSGSGTRMKILEAWAASTPVVATSVACEGLAGVNGEHLLIADTPHQFAARVGELLSSAKRRQEIGLAGRELFERNHTWDAAWLSLDKCSL